jgi:hypothetical protein
MSTATPPPNPFGTPLSAPPESTAAHAPVPNRTSDRLQSLRRRPKLAIAIVVVTIVMIPLLVTYAQALRKPGSESFQARTAEWMRDMRLGFVMDRIEQKYYETDKFPDGGTPDPGLLTATPTVPPISATTVSPRTPTVPHLAPPVKMASPVAAALPGEGEWTAVGPPVEGLSPAYTTKVRPNDQKTSLLVFVTWIDPLLTSIRQFPGTDLPGGKWNRPSNIPNELCPKAIMGLNSGFRMDQARGGYFAEDREPFHLREGAATFVVFKDGRVDIGEWGRHFTRDDLPRIETARQNLELMVDDGQPQDLNGTKDWGALLKNVYFVWRSGFGITKDGALVYAGGPALTPADLARTLINAGAVRVMEGDINPEWVTANLYKAGPDGACHGTKGLDGPEDNGGMRQPADRYLTTDTRDFIGVFAR